MSLNYAANRLTTVQFFYSVVWRLQNNILPAMLDFVSWHQTFFTSVDILANFPQVQLLTGAYIETFYIRRATESLNAPLRHNNQVMGQLFTEQRCPAVTCAYLWRTLWCSGSEPGSNMFRFRFFRRKGDFKEDWANAPCFSQRLNNRQLEINKDFGFMFFFFNCESCKASLVESQNKNIELEKSIIGPL